MLSLPLVKKILSERKDENRERLQRLVAQIGQLIVEGDSYAIGHKSTSKAATAPGLLDDLVNYLITNTYRKLPYLRFAILIPFSGDSRTAQC